MCLQLNIRKKYPSTTTPGATSILVSTLQPDHGDKTKRTRRTSGDKLAVVTGAKVAKRTSSRTAKAQALQRKQIASRSLINVIVNNRLGARYSIMCSPSDSIGDFKKIVAVYSGTKPERILLKRQGMRPFKDNLTLEDYEIGDGSSMNLELDTTD